MFRCKIDTDNAAFAEGREREVARILQEIRERVMGGFTESDIYDLNGNPVGNWKLKLPKERK